MDSRTAAAEGREDVIDLVWIAAVLWHGRLWLLAGIMAAVAGGLFAAFTSPAVYYSQATIALKEADKGGDASRLLSSFGGMGGLVASQFGLGNTSLDKIEIILKGHELAESVIVHNDLLPVLYPEKWDSTSRKWRAADTTAVPLLRDGVEKLQNGILTTSVDNKKGVLRLGCYFPDPAAAKRIVEFYLAALNEKIRDEVRVDGETNREYLEKLAQNTLDPVIREKIQNMIGYEIERVMLVSSRSFEVIDKPMEPAQRSKPNRKLIVALSLVFGIAASSVAIFAARAGAGFLARLRPMLRDKSEPRGC